MSSDTVDGLKSGEKTNKLRLVVHPIIYRDYRVLGTSLVVGKGISAINSIFGILLGDYDLIRSRD